MKILCQRKRERIDLSRSTIEIVQSDIHMDSGWLSISTSTSYNVKSQVLGKHEIQMRDLRDK